MNRVERTLASATVRRAPSGQRAKQMACRRCLFGCMLAAIALMSAVPVGAAEAPAQTNLEQWQLRRLVEPTQRERTHERRGNVYIYDGLADREVDRALDTQFDRIEYMMFLGTRKTGSAGAANNNAQGQAETESPGCK